MLENKTMYRCNLCGRHFNTEQETINHLYTENVYKTMIEYKASREEINTFIKRNIRKKEFVKVTNV